MNQYQKVCAGTSAIACNDEFEARPTPSFAQLFGDEEGDIDDDLLLRCTFGASNAQSHWRDVRSLKWSELCTLMTAHKIGAKEGPCIVPAVFSGTKRKNDDALQIDIMVLDVEGGDDTLESINAALIRCGWAGAIGSTWSSTPEAPRYRVMLRLARPWRASDFANQSTANSTWKAAVKVVAGMLAVSYDAACMDTGRLFYLPRHCAGTVPQTAVVEGQACDPWPLVGSLPECEEPARKGGKSPPPICDLDLPYSIECSREWLRDHAPEAIEGDSGRKTTIAVIQDLGDFGLSAGAIFDLLTEDGGWNETKAHPPWVASGDADELAQLVDDLWHNRRKSPAGCRRQISPLEEFEDLSAEIGADALLSRAEWEASRNNHGSEKSKPRFEMVNLGQLDWKPRNNYIVRDMLHRGSVGFITGKSDAGKTPLAMDLAAHVALGLDWNGMRVRQGLVVYVGLEGIAGLTKRLEALRRKHFSTVADPLFEVITTSLDLRASGRDVAALIEVINREAAPPANPSFLFRSAIQQTTEGPRSKS